MSNFKFGQVHLRWLLLLCLCVAALGATPQRPLEQRLVDVARQLPRAWYPENTEAPGASESSEAYLERMGVVAAGVVAATVRERPDGTHAVVPPDWRWGRTALVVAVYAHWYEESRFAYEVHAGLEHPVWDQDKGRARCMGQLHVGLVPSAEWERLAGTTEEATELCALWTARALTRMAHMCAKRSAHTVKLEDLVVPMFSAMGGGGCAPTVSGRAKAARFGKIWHELRRL